MVNAEKSKKVMQNIISVAGAIAVLSGAWLFIRNHVWKPYVTVIDVDWNKPFADLHINGVAKELYPNTKIAAGGDWAVRFNSSTNDLLKPDRIELVKNDIVSDIIDEKPALEAIPNSTADNPQMNVFPDLINS